MAWARCGAQAVPGAAVLLRTVLTATLAVAAGTALVRAVASTAADLDVRALTAAAPSSLERLVALATTAVGAGAAFTLAAGCALLLVAHGARAAGGATSRTALAAERAAALLTPRVVRRALALGVGGLLVAAPAAAATEPAPPPAVGLGWSVTSAPTTAHAAGPRSPGAVDDHVAAASGAVPVVADLTVPAAPRADAPRMPDDGVPDDGAHGDGAHVVVPGDSLWSIAAARLGPGADDAAVAASWPRWYAANADVVGPDPDLLLPGQVLTPPPASAGDAHDPAT